MSKDLYATASAQEAAMLQADQFQWENFRHKPLNIFDLGPWSLMFPGDISASRGGYTPEQFAAYSFDINDLNTCPRHVGQDGALELWNENSYRALWQLGREKWECIARSEDQVFICGTVRVKITVARFMNQPENTNLLNADDLLETTFRLVAAGQQELGFKPPIKEHCFQKTINEKTWVVSPSFNAFDEPDYTMTTAIDHRTAITLFCRISGAWSSAPIPAEIEAKYLESIWDFLSQFILTPSKDDTETGSIDRTPEDKKPKASLW